MTAQKIRVLFMQSQSYFGSDSMIHSLLMQYFDRSRVDVYVAVNRGSQDEPSAAAKALENVRNLHLRPTYFGATLNSRTKMQVSKDFLTTSIPTISSLAALAAFIRKNQIHILHSTEKPRDAFYGFVLSRLSGAKCIIHLHVKVENWISPLTRWAMQHADGLIGVSQFVAQSAVNMGYPAEKVYYVLNSLDASRWDASLSGAAVRNEFNISPDVPLLVIVSRLFPWKGHTELLNALEIVKQNVPRFRLLIVGEDDPRASPGHVRYTPILKKLVSELDLQEQVIFTGFRKDIPQILAAADIFTLPTIEEPCAVAFLEAMAMKKPVIALHSGGTPQLVEHGKTGLLSPPQDIDRLAANIACLIQDPALRSRMGENGRHCVEEYFAPERMANQVFDVYQHILGLSQNDAGLIYRRAAAR